MRRWEKIVSLFSAETLLTRRHRQRRLHQGTEATEEPQPQHQHQQHQRQQQLCSHLLIIRLVRHILYASVRRWLAAIELSSAVVVKAASRPGELPNKEVQGGPIKPDYFNSTHNRLANCCIWWRGKACSIISCWRKNGILNVAIFKFYSPYSTERFDMWIAPLWWNRVGLHRKTGKVSVICER